MTQASAAQIAFDTAIKARMLNVTEDIRNAAECGHFSIDIHGLLSDDIV